MSIGKVKELIDKKVAEMLAAQESKWARLLEELESSRREFRTTLVDQARRWEMQLTDNTKMVYELQEKLNLYAGKIDALCEHAAQSSTPSVGMPTPAGSAVAGTMVHGVSPCVEEQLAPAPTPEDATGSTTPKKMWADTAEDYDGEETTSSAMDTGNSLKRPGEDKEATRRRKARGVVGSRAGQDPEEES